jgi:hypothetical protein
MVVFEYWECPSCHKQTYLGRSNCKYCSEPAPPEVAARRKLSAPTPTDEVDSIISRKIREVAGSDSVHRVDLFQRVHTAEEDSTPKIIVTRPSRPPRAPSPETTKAHNKLDSENVRSDDGIENPLDRAISLEEKRSVTAAASDPSIVVGPTPTEVVPAAAPAQSSTVEANVAYSEVAEDAKSETSRSEGDIDSANQFAKAEADALGPTVSVESLETFDLDSYSLIPKKASKAKEVPLDPGTLVISNIAETSFEVRRFNSMLM